MLYYRHSIHTDDIDNPKLKIENEYPFKLINIKNECPIKMKYNSYWTFIASI